MAVEGRRSGGGGWGEEGNTQCKSVPEPTREIDFLAFDLDYHVSINEPMSPPTRTNLTSLMPFKLGLMVGV